jgi:hypothetical protein
MAIIYRTAGVWGAGKAANLTPVEVDQNFNDLDVRVTAVETNPAQPNQIASIDVVGRLMTITMTDHTTFGPFALPVTKFEFTGEFQPFHDYKQFQFLTNANILYMVLHDFTSEGAFIFGSDADGPFYQQIVLANPPTVYDIGFFFPGKPGTGIDAGNAMFALRVSSRSPFFLPAGLTNTSAGLLTAPDSDLSFPVYQDATPVGSIDFASGTTVGIYTFAAAVQFQAPNVLRVLRADAIDTSAFDLSVIFAATKGLM